jgi:O-antigen/teichoic acid export membrane protein
MIVVGLIASGQRGEAALVMVGVTLVKAVESIADVIYGFLQKQQRTDLIGRSQILKSPLYLAAIAGGYVAAGRLSVGLYAVVALSLLSTAALEGRQALRLGAVRRSRRHEPARPNPAAMWRIVRLALPLGVAGGLNSLRANIVRYLMAYFMGQGAVGIYAALAYVPAGVSLAASTLAQAVSPQLARAFVRGREAEFRMLAFKLLGVALGIGSGALGVVLLAGPRLLDVLYGARYAAEHPVFVIAMAGLGFTCAAAYMNDALVARRLMASQLRIICLVGVVETVLGALLLQGHGLRGAATATLIASALQCFAATWVAMSDSWGRRRAAQESAAC